MVTLLYRGLLEKDWIKGNAAHDVALNQTKVVSQRELLAVVRFEMDDGNIVDDGLARAWTATYYTDCLPVGKSAFVSAINRQAKAKWRTSHNENLEGCQLLFLSSVDVLFSLRFTSCHDMVESIICYLHGVRTILAMRMTILLTS